MTHIRSRRRILLVLVVTAILGVATGCTTPSDKGHTNSSPSGTTTATGDFTHPGVLVSRDQLDFVKKQVAAGAQPWKQAYDAMLATPYAAPGYRTRPRTVVDCGPYDHPNNGCSDERRDAAAAYTDALAWYISGRAPFAQKSIEIMDDWSKVLTDHTGSNAPLQSGWAASVWTRAAEIVRYTYTGWPGANKFADLLRKVYLPKVITGSTSNGNCRCSRRARASRYSSTIAPPTTRPSRCT